jgi:tRNA nucleotidyltransferase (CCA-adding enzyme)
MFTVPDTVLSVTEKLEEAGFEAYIVGGCVRDLILNKQPKDWDVTTNARPEQIQSLFEETFYENTYGTVGVVVESAAPSERVIEVTPYRTEGEYTNKRHPDSVSFSNDISDDLKRRDFTVNALAFRPRTQHFIDLFGGADDLRSGTLRSVGNAHTRFEEDALRMLRAIRFSAEHSFVIEAETMMAIAKHVSLLGHVSRERIRDELLKIVMSKNPQSGLFIAQRLGMLPYIIPELEDGIGCAQNQAHSFDVFEHLLRSMQCAADNDWGLDVRLTALLHDIGKPATRRWSEEKKDWTFYGTRSCWSKDG